MPPRSGAAPDSALGAGDSLSLEWGARSLERGAGSDKRGHHPQLLIHRGMLVGVAKLGDVEHVADRALPRLQLVVDVVARRSAGFGGIMRTRRRVVLGLCCLPVRPDLVNEAMMEEEDGIVR